MYYSLMSFASYYLLTFFPCSFLAWSCHRVSKSNIKSHQKLRYSRRLWSNFIYQLLKNSCMKLKILLWKKSDFHFVLISIVWCVQTSLQTNYLTGIFCPSQKQNVPKILFIYLFIFQWTLMIPTKHAIWYDHLYTMFSTV